MNTTTSNRLRLELKSIDFSMTYFAFTLLDRDGQRVTSVQSRFAGWPAGRGPGAVELREAAPILPDVMTDIWDDLCEPWIVVSTPANLYIYLLAGGNALVEQSFAERYFAQLVKPHAVVRPGPLGFERFDERAREVQRRRPRPPQRRRVLQRDHFECQLGGAREEDGAELVLHHVRMFSRGGPTTDENLVTLCKPCHTGLDPHEDEGLFFLPGGHLDRALRYETADAHRSAVLSYRSKMARVAAGLHGHR